MPRNKYKFSDGQLIGYSYARMGKGCRLFEGAKVLILNGLSSPELTQIGILLSRKAARSTKSTWRISPNRSNKPVEAIRFSREKARGQVADVAATMLNIR